MLDQVLGVRPLSLVDFVILEKEKTGTILWLLNEIGTEYRATILRGHDRLLLPLSGIYMTEVRFSLFPGIHLPALLHRHDLLAIAALVSMTL